MTCWRCHYHYCQPPLAAPSAVLLPVSADEAGHGFAVISSPVDEPVNYWNYAAAYSRQSCILPVRDTVTRKKFAPTLIAYRSV